jgi:hypothetical protein
MLDYSQYSSDIEITHLRVNFGIFGHKESYVNVRKNYASFPYDKICTKDHNTSIQDRGTNQWGCSCRPYGQCKPIIPTELAEQRCKELYAKYHKVSDFWIPKKVTQVEVEDVKIGNLNAKRVDYVDKNYFDDNLYSDEHQQDLTSWNNFLETLN